MQCIVDVYSFGKVYDANGNIIDMSGRIIEQTTQQFKRHMAGKLNSRTRCQHDEELLCDIRSMDCSELIVQTAADTSNIRGVRLPDGKPPEHCAVADLRDFVAARG